MVTSNGTTWISGTAGAGNVTGPGSSTANHVVTWNGTGGTSIKDGAGVGIASGVITSDSVISLITSSNGNITLTPNGSGNIVIGTLAGTAPTAIVQNYATTDTLATWAWRRSDATGNPNALNFTSSRGTPGSPTALQSGDEPFFVTVGGWDTAWVSNAMSFGTITTEVWSSGHRGNKWLWGATLAGSATQHTVMSLTDGTNSGLQLNQYTTAGPLVVDSGGNVTATPALVATSFTTNVIGGTLAVKSGSNALSGTVTLSSGAGTIASTAIDANTVIVLTLKTASGTFTQQPYVATITPATGCTVAGTATDNSTYNWVALKVN